MSFLPFDAFEMMFILHGVSLSHQDKCFHGSSLFQDNKVTGRKADVMMAAHMAAEAALRLVKPGNEVSPLPFLTLRLVIFFFFLLLL